MSSDCFSLPTMGETAVSISARIICMLWNKQKGIPAGGEW